MNGWIVLVLISALGLILRIMHLNDFGLTPDEALSVFFSTAKIGVITSGNQAHNNPALYFLLLHGWESIFSTSETSIRSLSIIIGTITIPCIAVLGTYLWDRRTGLIAALTMAVMVFPIHFSQIARNYSLFLLLSVLCFYFFLRSVESKSKWNWIAYFVSAVALIYTHTYSGFLLLIQNIYVFLFYREKKILLFWIAVQILIVLCTIPWLVILFHKSATLLETGFWIPQPTMTDLMRVLRTYFSFLVFPPVIWIYLLLISYSVFKTFRSSSPSQQDKRHTTLLLLWAMASILIPFCLSFFVTPFFVMRYTIGSLPALYLLFANGLNRFPLRTLKVIAVSVMLFSCVLSLHRYYDYSPLPSRWQNAYTSFDRYQWRELIAEVVAKTSRRDVISVDWSHKFLFRYYAPQMVTQTIPVLNENSTEEEQLQGFAKMALRKRRFWLVFGFPPTANQRLLLTVLDKHYKQLNPGLSDYRITDSSVYLFSLKSLAD